MVKNFYFCVSKIQIRIVNSLIGTYECKIDSKGRLMIPASLKKQFVSLEDGFVLKRSVFQPCLELFPMSEWNMMMQKINNLNRFVKKNDDFIRRFMSGVKVVEIDVTGRLLIPKDLVVFGKIDKDVVLSSALNIVEIWDKNLYETAVENATDDFAHLAEEVMGNKNNFEDELS